MQATGPRNPRGVTLRSRERNGKNLDHGFTRSNTDSFLDPCTPVQIRGGKGFENDPSPLLLPRSRPHRFATVLAEQAWVAFVDGFAVRPEFR